MTRNEALKNALNHLRHVGLIENYKDAALKMGADPSNISRYINGAKVSDKFLRRFNEAFGNIFRMEYLSEGEGEMLASDVTPVRKSELEEYTETKAGLKFYTREDGQIVMKVPIVPVSAMGSPDDEFAEIIREHDGDTVTVVVDSVHHGNYVAFHVDGDSMDDGRRDSFERGDIVVVRELSRDKWLPRLHFNKWPYWVVCFGNNVRLKEIIAQDEDTGTITCHSLNPSPEYTDFTLNLDEVHRLFNVVRKVPKDIVFG